MLPCPPFTGFSQLPIQCLPPPPIDCSDDGGAAGWGNRWAPGYVGEGQVGTKVCGGGTGGNSPCTLPSCCPALSCPHSVCCLNPQPSVAPYPRHPPCSTSGFPPFTYACCLNLTHSSPEQGSHPSFADALFAFIPMFRHALAITHSQHPLTCGAWSPQER